MMVVVVLIEVFIINFVNGIIVINKIINGSDFKILIKGFKIWCIIILGYMFCFWVIINKIFNGILIIVFKNKVIDIIYSVLYNVCNNCVLFKLELNIC